MEAALHYNLLLTVGRAEGGSFLLWYNLDVVVRGVFSFGLMIPWVVASNRSVPNYLFFRSPHVSVVWSFLMLSSGMSMSRVSEEGVWLGGLVVAFNFPETQ